MKKLLVHVCCGPCSTHCIKELKKEFQEIALFFYNPNIHPFAEYDRRVCAAKTVAEKNNIDFIEHTYDAEEWVSSISGLEEEPEGGRRCELCFCIRLNIAAEYAKTHGFNALTTTLSISPHKDSKVINQIGEQSAEEHKLDWIHSDFKKNNGFKKSIELSKKLNLYRQKYCGCFYSIRKQTKK